MSLRDMLPQKQMQELIRGMQLIMRIRYGKNWENH